MPRRRHGHGHGRGAAATAAEAASAAHHQHSDDASASNNSKQVLYRIPIVQRILKYAARSVARLVQLSEVTDTWQETVVVYGAVILMTAVSPRDASADASEKPDRHALLVKMFKAIVCCPNFPFIACQFFDVWAAYHHPAALGKRVPDTRGLTILHALSYRHDLLTEAQCEGRLMQLRHLLAVAPSVNVNIVAKRPGHHLGLNVLLREPPWSCSIENSPLQMAIDGRASAAFLRELVLAKTARHAAGAACGTSRMSALQLAASAANATALEVLVDCGKAEKLIPLEHGANNALCFAIARALFGYPLVLTPLVHAGIMHATVIQRAEAKLSGRQAAAAHSSAKRNLDFAIRFMSLLLPRFAVKSPECVAEAAALVFRVGELMSDNKAIIAPFAVPVPYAATLDDPPPVIVGRKKQTRSRWHEPSFVRAEKELARNLARFYFSTTVFNASDRATLEVGRCLLTCMTRDDVIAALHAKKVAVGPFTNRLLPDIEKMAAGEEQKKHDDNNDDGGDEDM